MFIESPRFPDWMSFWMTGGQGFQTIIANTYGGEEFRTATWDQPLAQYDLQDAFSAINPLSAYAFIAIRDLFDGCFAQLIGFRVKDFKSYKDEGRGILGLTGLGTGVLTYQMYKTNPVNAERIQIIQKPLTTGIAILKNAVAAAGATYDPATGLATFVATASQTITGATAGATTVFHLTAPLTGAANGKKVVVLGTSGNIGALTNGNSATITNVSGSDVTIDIDTTGWTGGVGGTMNIGPQPADVLTWTGEYDWPVRFADDFPNMGPDQSTGAQYDWQNVKLQQIRDIL